MNTMMLAASVNSDVILEFNNIADALGYGLPFSLFAMLVVFGALIIIWACLALLKVFCYTIPNAKKNGSKNQTSDKPAVKTQTSSAPVAVQAPASAAPETASLSVAVQEHSVVAAIVSAISAFRTANGESGAFRVVSFKKRK